jgi:hypothetical protein
LLSVVLPKSPACFDRIGAIRIAPCTAGWVVGMAIIVTRPRRAARRAPGAVAQNQVASLWFSSTSRRRSRLTRFKESFAFLLGVFLHMSTGDCCRQVEDSRFRPKLNRSETQIRTGGRVNCIGAGFGIGFATAAPISKTPLSPGRRSLLACLFREITCQERELPVYVCQMARRTWRMRPVLLWALGIPIPVIILLYLFHVI